MTIPSGMAYAIDYRLKILLLQQCPNVGVVCHSRDLSFVAFREGGTRESSSFSSGRYDHSVFIRTSFNSALNTKPPAALLSSHIDKKSRPPSGDESRLPSRCASSVLQTEGLNIPVRHCLTLPQRVYYPSISLSGSTITFSLLIFVVQIGILPCTIFFNNSRCLSLVRVPR